jgi:transglutaminase-like putative cysteine protease
VLSQLTQSGVGPGNGRGGGLSDSVDLFANLSGTLTQNDTFDMVKVTTTEREPFYLRFGVADVVDENGFREQDPQGLQVSRGLPEPEIIAGDGVSQQAHRATVEVTNRFNMRRAPLYPTLRSTGNFDGSWLYDADTGVLFSTRESSRGRRYEFDYVRTLYSEQALRTAPELPANDPIRRRSGVVPNDPFVAELVDRLTRDADTEYDKVEAIYRHFSAKNGFTYNLTTKPATNASQIVSFLQNKIGFCQQYAAAMAWMVRQAGIPARVAFGFTRGTARDRGLVMTNRNLHAWTEVYFSGFGWVPFDATPASAVVGAARSEWAPDVDRVDQAPTSAGPAPSTSAGGASTAPSTPDRDRDRDLGAAGGPGTITPTGPSWQAVSAVGGTVLLLILLSLPAVLRMLRRRRRHAATLRAPQPTAAQPDQDPSAAPRMVVTATDAARARRDAHAAWDELVDTMIDYDVDVDPTETPRVTANRLVRQVSLAGPAAEAATLLGRAEERARYARAPLAGQELTTALDRVRHAVAAGSSRRTRLRAAVLPPSVLLRWRHALGGTTERVVALFSRAGDALIRFSPRRLLPHRR